MQIQSVMCFLCQLLYLKTMPFMMCDNIMLFFFGWYQKKSIVVPIKLKKNCMETMLFSVSLSFLCLWRVNIQRQNHMIERYEYEYYPCAEQTQWFQNRAPHTKHTIFNMLFTHKSPNTSCQVFKLIRLLHVVKLFSN